MKSQTKLNLECLETRQLLSADLNVVAAALELPPATSEPSVLADGTSCCPLQNSEGETLPAAVAAVAGARQHTNPANCLDVNNDGYVTPMDALNVVNTINGIGLGRLSSLAGEDEDGLPFVDVNGDGSLSPLDLLQIVDFLNSNAAQQQQSVVNYKPFTNPDNPLDVDGSGSVDLVDASLLVDDEESHGVRQLPLQGAGADLSPYLDVDGDKFASPYDLRLVVNYLNRNEIADDTLASRPSRWAENADLAFEALGATESSSTVLDTLDLEMLFDDLAYRKPL